MMTIFHMMNISKIINEVYISYNSIVRNFSMKLMVVIGFFFLRDYLEINGRQKMNIYLYIYGENWKRSFMYTDKHPSSNDQSNISPLY